MAHTPQDIDNLINAAREFANALTAHDIAIKSDDNTAMSKTAYDVELATDVLNDATYPFGTIAPK